VFTVQVHAQLEFTLHQSIPTVQYGIPRAADVDNDGDLDFIYEKLYLNDGSGNFTLSSPEQVFGSRGYFGNFNGDEYIDYVDGYSKKVYLNDPLNPGNFIFKAVISMRYNLANFEAVDITDLNGDGIDDIVKAEYPIYVDVYLSNGDGTFTNAQRLSTGKWGYCPNSVRAGDFDGDGDMDLVATINASKFTLYENVGQGSFIALGGYTDYGLGVYTYAVLGDINGDGHLDIVAAGSGYSYANAFFGDGNFGFEMVNIGRVKRHWGWLRQLKDYDGRG
jgi:hypothetical protein